MKYAMIQTAAVNSNTWALVRLYDGAFKSPAGYIVGKHDVLVDGLTNDEATIAHAVACALTADCNPVTK